VLIKLRDALKKAGHIVVLNNQDCKSE